MTRFVSFLYKIALRGSQEVWFLNEEDRLEFITRGIVTQEKTRILPGEGVDTDEYKYDPCFPKQPVFLMISRLLRDKGVLEFVEAARLLKASHPNVGFRLLGPIDENNPTAVSREQVFEWHNQGLIEYLGVAEDVKPYISQCTAVVLPSSYREGVPRVLLEGASMGRVLLATNIPGCRDVVENGENGFLINPNSLCDLVDSAKKIVSFSLEELKNMGLKSRSIATSKYDNIQVLNCYIGFLHSDLFAK